MQYLSELAARPELATKIEGLIGKYIARRGVRASVEKKKKKVSLDSFGRAYGQGKRKTAVADVWIIPAKEALPMLNEVVEVAAGPEKLVDPAQPMQASQLGGVNFTAAASGLPLQPGGSSVLAPPDPSGLRLPMSLPTFDPSQMSSIPMGQILVNQLPIPLFFDKQQDREVMLRPLRLTGLIGAFNTFALVRGGGSTGQAGAIALGLSRALVAFREDLHPVLYSGASRPAGHGVLC